MRLPFIGRLALSAAAFGALHACSAAPPQPAARTSPAPSSSAANDATQSNGSRPAEARAAFAQLLPASGWGKRWLPALALEVRLPDAEGWRSVRGTRWARLEHRRSQSRLELSLARAERLVKVETCEQRARLEHPELPRPTPEGTLERRGIALSGDFHGEVVVSIEGARDALSGHVTLFAASLGRCLAAHFVTQARGTGAEEALGERLQLAVREVLPSLAPVSADERVRPEPLAH